MWISFCVMHTHTHTLKHKYSKTFELGVWNENRNEWRNKKQAFCLVSQSIEDIHPIISIIARLFILWPDSHLLSEKFAKNAAPPKKKGNYISYGRRWCAGHSARCERNLRAIAKERSICFQSINSVPAGRKGEPVQQILLFIFFSPPFLFVRVCVNSCWCG